MKKDSRKTPLSFCKTSTVFCEKTVEFCKKLKEFFQEPQNLKMRFSFRLRHISQYLSQRFRYSISG